MKPTRVAVIGAGAAGLVALRHLTARPETFEAVAYEQTGSVGGTWVYTERTGTDEHGLPIHSSMYKAMKTNLPKEIMAFPDFPFYKNLPSFVGHADVSKYLEDYTAHFTLARYIQFFTCVQGVKPKQSTTGGVLWDVTTKSVKQPDVPPQTREFDAVMICNGHFSDPLIPDIPGLKTFKGKVAHSHDYRHPEEFSGLRTIVLGSGPSGIDISLEIAPLVPQVFLSHNKPLLQCPLPDNLTQVPGISSVNANSVVLRDGQEKEVNCILLCTGYHVRFPFLSPECAVNISNQRVSPVYKHLIHTNYPSLCLVGICNAICPFPLFHNQVKYFLGTLDGSVKLPSKEEMDLDAEKEFNERLESGVPAHHAHRMSNRQWSYNDSLADLGNFERLPQVIQKIYRATHDRRLIALMNYKKDLYEIVDHESYKFTYEEP